MLLPEHKIMCCSSLQMLTDTSISAGTVCDLYEYIKFSDLTNMVNDMQVQDITLAVPILLSKLPSGLSG